MLASPTCGAGMAGHELDWLGRHGVHFNSYAFTSGPLLLIVDILARHLPNAYVGTRIPKLLEVGSYPRPNAAEAWNNMCISRMWCILYSMLGLQPFSLQVAPLFHDRRHAGVSFAHCSLRWDTHLKP